MLTLIYRQRLSQDEVARRLQVPLERVRSDVAAGLRLLGQVLGGGA